MAKRDVSWIKPGVRVWLANGTAIIEGTVFEENDWSRELFYLEGRNDRSWQKKLAFKTEAEAGELVRRACIRQANRLEREAAELRARAATYAKPRKAVKRGKA